MIGPPAITWLGVPLRSKGTTLGALVVQSYREDRRHTEADLDLLVFPQVTKAIDLPRILNVPVLSSIANAWFRNVNEIRIEGTLDSPALRRRAFPFLNPERRAFTQSAHAVHARTVRPRVLPE